jgi:hypothetical protein
MRAKIMAIQGYATSPQPEDESLAEAMDRHAWRILAIYEWAMKRGVTPDALVEARHEVHLSDEDVAAELDYHEPRVIPFPTPLIVDHRSTS